VWLLATPAVAAAEEKPAGSWHYDLSQHLMSPYCPGRTLVDCSSSQAAELREWIAAQEQAGVSREAVEQQLYQEFGDVILQAPKASGFGLAAYVIPAIGLLAGGAFVALFLRRQAAGVPVAASAAGPSDPELERRIDEEMRRS
jgi:cytochrome c-type biogenesis protein CcmH